MAGDRRSVFGDDAREIFGPLPCSVLIEAERPLLAAGPGESLEAAVNRMWWRKVGALPVVHEGRLAGCLAEEDLLRVLADRLCQREAGVGSELVWSDLLAEVCVRDAMTPLGKLPVVESNESLLRGLKECCAPHAPRGRYLFLVDRSPEGDHVQLASFRDVARLLTRVYAGEFDVEIFPDEPTAARALRACRRMLSVPIGSLRNEFGLGHTPNLIAEGVDARDTIRAMAAGNRGYVLVTLPEGGPIGICTRRDVLGGIRPRHADLARLDLRRLMSDQVMTVADSNTLCGLFHRMASASCRHMPLVDGWDHVESVISMWEAISIVTGESPGGDPGDGSQGSSASST